MSIKNIYTAINTQLLDAGLSFDLVLPNESVDTSDLDGYGDVYHIPSAPESAEVGRAEYITGLTQIDLHAALDQGGGKTLDYIDEIRAAFPLGSTFVYDTAKLRIESAGPVGAGESSDGWFTQQFDIYWSAYENV